jgi:hypothetical protein
MKNNEESFKYFICDISFEEYLENMKQDGGKYLNLFKTKRMVNKK